MLLIEKCSKILIQELNMYTTVVTPFGICATHALHHANMGMFIFIYARSRGAGAQRASGSSTRGRN
jgi:hypothetical protein